VTGYVLFAVTQTLCSVALVFTGAYLHARYGQVLGYRMRAPHNDPHQHCDRHPIRCSHRALLDDARADNERAQNYRDTLQAVAVCPKCAGCATAAKAALTITYEPD
jgi:hypothetical protein